MAHRTSLDTHVPGSELEHPRCVSHHRSGGVTSGDVPTESYAVDRGLASIHRLDSRRTRRVSAENASPGGKMTVFEVVVSPTKGGTFCEASIARNRPDRGDLR